MFALFGLSVRWYFVSGEAYIPERKAFFNYWCEKSGLASNEALKRVRETNGKGRGTLSKEACVLGVGHMSTKQKGEKQCPSELVRLRHIFIDHSNMWGGDRLASRIKNASIADETARISIKTLDRLLGGKKLGTSTKIVCGGIPPGIGKVSGKSTVHVDTTLRDCSEGPTGKNEVWTMQ